MPGGHLSNLVRLVRDRMGAAPASSDAELLERFVRQQDEGAFEELLRRHGPAVLGLCRRWLRDPHQAEDAFQVTFLILVRKASSIAKRASLASWLHGVAYRVTRKALAADYRRQVHEQRVREMTTHANAPDSTDLQPVLDEELNRLPVKYRDAVMLCYVEGKSRQAAAEQLGWSEATIHGRLERGREKLRRRLQKRGIQVSSAGLVAALGASACAAEVPAALARSTLEAALIYATGKPACAGTAAVLLQGVLQDMFWTKFKIMALVFLVVGLTAGAGLTAIPFLTSGNGPVASSNPGGPRPKNANANTRIPAPNREALPIAQLGRGKRLRHGTFVSRLAFSPDGRTFYSGAINDPVIRQWDTATGNEIRQYQAAGHQRLADLSPDGKVIAAIAGGQSRINLWDTATGKPLPQFADSKLTCTSLSFSPDGKILAGICSRNGKPRKEGITFWDWKTAKEVRHFPGSFGPWCLAFSPDGALLATSLWSRALKKHQIVLLDLATGRSRQFGELPDYIFQIAFAPDGKTLAVGGPRLPHVGIWDVATGKNRGEFDVSKGYLKQLTYSRDGKQLVAGCAREDGKRGPGGVHLWNLKTAQEETALDQALITATGSAAYSPDGRILALGGGNSSKGIIRLFQAGTAKELAQSLGDLGPVRGLFQLPDGKTLVSAEWDQVRNVVFRIWDIPSGRAIQEFRGPRQFLMAAKLSSDGRTLALGDGSSSIRLWNAATRTEQPALAGHKGAAWPVAFSRDGKRLITRDQDNTVRTWELSTRKVLGSFRLTDRYGGLLPDAQHVVTWNRKGLVRVCDLATGKEARQFRVATDMKKGAFGGPILARVFIAPDGNKLATLFGMAIEPPRALPERMSWKVHYWDLASGKKLNIPSPVIVNQPSLPGPRFYVASTGRVFPAAGTAVFATSPDGSTLARLGKDNTIEVVEAGTNRLLRKLQGHQGRILSLAFSINNRQLASGSEDGTILIWDVSR